MQAAVKKTRRERQSSRDWPSREQSNYLYSTRKKRERHSKNMRCRAARDERTRQPK